MLYFVVVVSLYLLMFIVALYSFITVPRNISYYYLLINIRNHQIISCTSISSLLMFVAFSLGFLSNEQELVVGLLWLMAFVGMGWVFLWFFIELERFKLVSQRCSLNLYLKDKILNCLKFALVGLCLWFNGFSFGFITLSIV